jgi:glucosamine-6-phosphate deaminase
MQLIIKQDYDEVSRWAASYIAKKINDHADSSRPFVLGLPTGSTPMRTYGHLIELQWSGKVSFKNVATFNMDEYVGLPKNHSQSCHTFMQENFFKHIDILPENIHILNGNATDLQAECDAYEEKIRKAGGVDLFLGGVGADGHIAFNEPGASMESRTRVKMLTDDAVIANSRFFNNNINAVPRQALTVGAGTIMDAKEVLIIASGHNKARALHHAVEGSLNRQWTITALQTHRKGLIVCDETATAELMSETCRYFKEMEVLCGNLLK